MTREQHKIYGIAHLIRDYAREQCYRILSFTNIEDFLFSEGIDFTEAQLFNTLKEMMDAGWLNEVSYSKRFASFNWDVIKQAA